jgi:hypothetical protein
VVPFAFYSVRIDMVLMIHLLAVASLVSGIASSLWIVVDEAQRPQRMAVMNWVWPLIALSGGPLTLWLYRRHHLPGRKSFAFSAAVATCHCGAGCTLGDLVSESMIQVAPGILTFVGLGTLFGQKIVAGWVLDFVLAFLAGIVFQYFSIAPMRKLGLKDGIIAALKADTLSLMAWQIGMYGVMAIVQFSIAHLVPSRVEFWFAMQIAMLAGFAASYPVNWLLLSSGIKEKM